MPALAPHVWRELGGDPVSHRDVGSMQETDSQKLLTASGIAAAPVLTRIDYTGRETSGMTVLQQLRGKVLENRAWRR